MEQNFKVFDFMLNDVDMQDIAALDESESVFFAHYDPKKVEFSTGIGKE